jgi:glycine cleavage system regulatory protein
MEKLTGIDQVTTAPMSGEPTFNARARLVVPATVTLAELSQALEQLGSHLMVDIELEEL